MNADMKWLDNPEVFRVNQLDAHSDHCYYMDYTDMENLVTWLMTFGAKAEVLEPKEARDIIRRNAEETLKSYGGLGK